MSAEASAAGHFLAAKRYLSDSTVRIQHGEQNDFTLTNSGTSTARNGAFVVIDLQMPATSGLDVLKAMQGYVPPVVIIDAHQSVATGTVYWHTLGTGVATVKEAVGGFAGKNRALPRAAIAREWGDDAYLELAHVGLGARRGWCAQPQSKTELIELALRELFPDAQLHHSREADPEEGRERPSITVSTGIEDFEARFALEQRFYQIVEANEGLADELRSTSVIFE